MEHLISNRRRPTSCIVIHQAKHGGNQDAQDARKKNAGNDAAQPGLPGLRNNYPGRPLPLDADANMLAFNDTDLMSGSSRASSQPTIILGGHCRPAPSDRKITLTFAIGTGDHREDQHIRAIVLPVSTSTKNILRTAS